LEGDKLKVESKNYEDLYQKLIDSWPSEIVARSEIEKFTGGLLRSKTLANMDCQGTGPEGKITFGRNVGYFKRPLVQWLRNLAETKP
jgi:hypothetical protein